MRISIMTLCLCLVSVAPGPAFAQEADLYTISDIAVDATAENAVTARNQAHREGQREGLRRLLQRLVPASDHARLPDASVQADRYVQNFEIADEQLSSTRYLAKMTVAFDPERIRDLLQSERLPFSERVSPPLVILPLYLSANGPLLWPENNPWWNAWAQNLESERPLRLIMPLGDLEDRGAMTIEQAQSGDRLALQRLASRYGAKDAIVVSVEPLSDPASGGPVSLRLNAQRVGSQSRTGQPFTLDGAPGQPFEELLQASVVRLQDSLDEEWKSQHILRLDTGGLMSVDIPIDSLDDWVKKNRELENLPVVSQVEIAAFAQTMVRAQIYYVGDEAGFRQALGRLGFTLSREEESWLLLPTAAAPRIDQQRNRASTSS